MPFDLKETIKRMVNTAVGDVVSDTVKDIEKKIPELPEINPKDYILKDVGSVLGKITAVVHQKTSKIAELVGASSISATFGVAGSSITLVWGGGSVKRVLKEFNGAISDNHISAKELCNLANTIKPDEAVITLGARISASAFVIGTSAEATQSLQVKDVDKFIENMPEILITLSSVPYEVLKEIFD